MQLAGVHHITIAPLLLAELAATPASSLRVASLFDGDDDAADSLGGSGGGSALSFVDDEAGYRIAFNRSGNGEGARKLIQVSYSCLAFGRVLVSGEDRELMFCRPLISFVICS
jgi:hypothetical protein